MGKNAFSAINIGRNRQPEPVTELPKLPPSQRVSKVDSRRGVSIPFPSGTTGRVRKPHTQELLAGTMDPHETVVEVIACNDYLRMGPARNIAGLHRIYQKDPLYSRALSSLYHYSWDYGWAARADEYDTRLETAKNKVAEEVLTTGLSLSYTRIKKLKRLAQLLEEEIARPGRLYITDTKQIGTGKYAREVSTIRFNSALIEQYRAVMDDIAKETGGRIKLGGSGDIPIHIDVNLKDVETNELSDDGWHPEEVKTVANGFGKSPVKVKIGELVNASEISS